MAEKSEPVIDNSNVPKILQYRPTCLLSKANSKPMALPETPEASSME